MDNERLYVGHVGEQREQLQALGELLCGLGVALDLEGEYRRRAVREVAVVKLLLASGRERRMVDALDLRVVLQVVYDLQRVLDMAFEPQRKRLKSLKQQEGVERRDGRALISHQRRAKLEDVCQIPARLGEYHAVIGGIRLGKSGELAACGPVKFAGIHNHSAHYRSVSADKLGGRMNDYVRAVLDRTEQIRRREGVVHDQRNTVPVSNGGYRFEVDDVRVGVAERLGIEQLGVRPDGFFKILRIRRINECHGESLFVKGVREKVVRAAVEVGRGDDVVSRDGYILHRVGYRGRTGGRCECRGAALQSGYPLLKHVGGRVHEAGVDVSALGQAKTSCGLRRILEDIRGGGVYWYRACVGCGIGRLLAYMDLQRFKFIIRHDAFSFPYQ